MASLFGSGSAELISGFFTPLNDLLAEFGSSDSGGSGSGYGGAE